MNAPKVFLLLLVLGSVGLGAVAVPKLPLLVTTPEASLGTGPLEGNVVLSIENDWKAEANAEWSEHIVSQGETLAALWNRQWGLPLRTLYQLGADPESARLLDRVHPGQQIEWQVDYAGELGRLRLWVDRSRGYEWVRLDGTERYTRIEIDAEREISHRVLMGEVQDRLSDALLGHTRLPPAAARSIGRLLDDHRQQVDGVRNGDSFTLLLEIETLVGDEKPYDVRLLAFTFAGATHSMTAVRHINGHFFSPEGHPKLPQFDRHPFHGEYRLTSGFNKGRRHPVTGRVAPHFGADFSMPPGTPVVAPADGVVTLVDSHPLAGNFVEIEHANGFATRYLHLQRALVRTGQQVTRGQRIALSGDSGRTTSAHLHYEVHVNGRPMDPMRVELPRGEPLEDAEMAQFRQAALPLLAELREALASRQLAMQPASGSGSGF